MFPSGLPYTLTGVTFHPLIKWTGATLQLLVARSEIGQGVITALAMLVADELHVPLDFIDWNHSRYDPNWPNQGTSASVSIFTEYDRYRRASSALYNWVVREAARRWDVDVSAVTSNQGVLIAKGRQNSSYAEVFNSVIRSIELPMTEPRVVPGPLRGTSPNRLEGRSKVDGSAAFGADVRPPGLSFAAYWYPAAGERVVGCDLSAVRRLPGIENAAIVGDGVAIIARSTWQARGAKAILRPRTERFDEAPRDTAEVEQAITSALRGPLILLRQVGAAGSRSESQAMHLRASYSVPFLAHAPMEPPVATALVRQCGAMLWLSTQHPERARQAVAKALSLSANRVQIEKTLVGGGFGRKTYPDIAVLAARIAALVPSTPIQLLLSREDDLAADFYRPPSRHELHAKIDAGGKLISWHHRAAAPSINAWYENNQDGAEPDDPSLSGVDFDTYDTGAFFAEGKTFRTSVRCGIWRSIGHLSSCFANEWFIDEAAHAVKLDPVDFRMAHLQHAPRTAAVLRRAATLAGWSKYPTAGRQLGAALFREYFPQEAGDPAAYEVIVAHVAQLTRHDGLWKLDKLFVVVDCGQVIHPGMVRAQMEGAAAWALTALGQAIEITNGRCLQTNFHEFTPLRFDSMPIVEVDIIPSDRWPAGVGEKGVPGVIPAVLNAWFRASGRRVRRLPFSNNFLKV